MKIPTPEALTTIAEALSAWVPTYTQFSQAVGTSKGSNLSVLRKVIDGPAPLGFTVLGSGLRRAVFVHEDYPEVVFKVEYPESGKPSHNLSEVVVYKGMTAQQKKCVPKVVAHDNLYKVVVMERVQGTVLLKLSATKQWEVNDKVTKLKTLFRDSDSCQDLHHNNLMVTPKGKVFLVDYAM